jgi:ComF family protein
VRLPPPAAEGRAWGRTLLNLCFPVFCRGCGERVLTDEYACFCATCWELSPRVESPFCTVCGRPHKESLGFGMRQNFPCADCRENPNPHIRRIYGAAHYAGAVEKAIKLFKFHGIQRLAKPLGAEMRAFAEREMDPSGPGLVIPVPLHRVRARDRGFNQSLLLAREVAPFFADAEIDESLRRIRPTRTQSRLRGTARRENVKGAFAVEGNNCRGRNVLLIDDVVTSAGTVTECASVLKAAGTAAVDVFVAALAVPDRDLAF